MSLTCSFHCILQERVIPSMFAFVTMHSSFPSTIIGSKICLVVLKSITSSLHLSAFSWSLFSRDQSSTTATACETWLLAPLGTTSARVVSSTYFHVPTLGILSSFIIRRNNQGPSLVPWGTPDGAWPHSEKQSWESFTRWYLFTRKSHTHRAIARGIGKLRILLQWNPDITKCQGTGKICLLYRGFVINETPL